jgi:hypothetical protein
MPWRVSAAPLDYSIHHRDWAAVGSNRAPVQAMNLVRGIVMLIAGCFALFESWRVLHGSRAIFALLLGLVALALSAWHLTRRDPKRL